MQILVLVLNSVMLKILQKLFSTKNFIFITKRHIANIYLNYNFLELFLGVKNLVELKNFTKII